MAKDTLTRRSFLKAAAGTSALLASGGAASALMAQKGIAEEQSSGEEVFHGVCRGNCQGCCALDLHVRDGAIFKVTRGESGDPYKNRVCARGMSTISRVYGPARNQYPMRRSGERGEGKFERISWDDAINEIAQKWTAYREEFGPQSIAFTDGTGNLCCLNGVIPGMLGLTRNVLDATYVQFCIDFQTGVALGRVFGSYNMNLGANEPTDMKNAKSVFLWGANITNAQPQDWHMLCDAMEGGTKLVVIDPVFTQAASKADLWVPVRPGSDGALYFGIMNRILEVDGQNNEFLLNHSCAPFLVRADNGMYLRMSDLGVEPLVGDINPMTGAPTIIDPNVVWSASQQRAMAVDECPDPVMSGSFTVNGLEVTCAYDLLKARIAEYPLDKVSQMTEVPVETIIQLADLVMDTPVTHRIGWGTQAWKNGVHTIQAGLTMAALVGNVGYPGACFGSWFDGPMGAINFGYTMPTGPSASATIPDVALAQVLETGTYMDNPYPLKSIYISHINPLSSGANQNNYVHNIIDKFEFVVVADTEFSDTAMYADLLLPAAHWYEVEDMLLAGTTGYIQHTEKAIDPLYESRSDADILRAICTAMGFGEFVSMSDQEFLHNMLDTEYAGMLGLSYEGLKRDHAQRYYPTESFIAYENYAFTTPSGRAEFYCEAPQPRVDMGLQLDPTNERMAVFVEPGEAWPENPSYQKYPIVMMSERARFRVHTQWSKTPWLNEIDPEPVAKVNPQDAAARGIADGDYIEVFNDRGHAVARAHYSEGVRPGMLLYPKGWQNLHFKAGNWSELTTMDYDLYGVNQNFMDNLCDFRAWAE